MKYSRSLLPLCFFVLFACGDDGAPVGPDAAMPDSMPASVSCMEAENYSDLPSIQSEIFDKSCANFSVCHMGNASSAGGLNLEDGNSEANMVNIDSVRITDFKMVVPGDPDNSYLMVILGDVDGPITDGIGTMPFNNPILCKEKRDAIRRWIGALPAI
jgi:hypothetical protein